MTKKHRPSVYLDGEQKKRLVTLASQLNVTGQRGPGLTPLLHEIDLWLQVAPEYTAHMMTEIKRYVQGEIVAESEET